MAPFPGLPRKPTHSAKPAFGLSPPGSGQWLFPQGSHTLLGRQECVIWPRTGSPLPLDPGTPAGRHSALVEGKWYGNRSFQGQDFISQGGPHRSKPQWLCMMQATHEAPSWTQGPEQRSVAQRALAAHLPRKSPFLTAHVLWALS